MFQFLRSKRRRAGHRDWSILSLESRILPSAIQVFSTSGPGSSFNLRFEGTSANEVVLIEPDSTVPGSVSVQGLYEGLSLNGGPVQFTLKFPAIHNIHMNLGTGNDRMTLASVSVNDVTIEDGVTATETGVYVIASNGSAMVVGDVEARFRKGDMSVEIGVSEV